MTAHPTIIKRRRVQLEAVHRVPTRAQAASKAQADAAHEKSVRALTSDGRVQAIEVTCSCGEITLVELDYDRAPEAPNA